MDAEGLGRKLLLTPSGDPRRTAENSEKQTVGTVAASHKMLTLQALSSSFNAGTAKRGCLGQGEAFGYPPAICPPERPRPFTRDDSRHLLGEYVGAAEPLLGAESGTRTSFKTCDPTLNVTWRARPYEGSVAFAKIWVLPEDYCKKDPRNFNTEMFVSKVGQPMSNSWSTSSQPDLVRALGRRKTVRNRQGKILYTELLKSWPTLGQLLANSPPHGTTAGVFLAIVLWQHPKDVFFFLGGGVPKNDT